MYFWNIKNVREELATGKISERNAFKYFIAHALWLSVLLIPSSEEYKPDSWILIVWVVITIGGLFYVRHGNGGYEGENFFTRFFAIAWVMEVKFFALMLLLALAGVFYEGATDSDVRADFPVTYGLLGLGIYGVLFYWRIGVHMRRTKELAK
ncbi:hypothetical protein CWE09_07590 [Aliidiomarina minuta]|uniref:Uncharacterized protein n=1 Tax=Aliidiomarina minuta TaxID=880057 RepID=A0A432W8U0_9GAMM|nr:hypothetical protein [Aliidiomarina minuta]RUO26560.1 hypothetical protein CWE09_07590 [Aliidiomarina minuta]